jgi:hypothetical protein
MESSKIESKRAAKIGTEERKIFGTELKSSLGPGPAAYETHSSL